MTGDSENNGPNGLSWSGLDMSNLSKTNLLSAAAIVALLLVSASAGYAFVVPPDDTGYSELFLVTEDEDGFTASGYPTEFAPGELQSLYVGVGNHEGETTTYAVAVELHRVDRQDGSIRVLEKESITQERLTVADGERRHQAVDISPSILGEQLRLTFLLYPGPAPEDPTVENAYREAHLWINVTS